MDHSPPEKSHAPKRYKGEGRVAFLANLEDIREQVEAGWPIKAVFDRHKAHLNIQYMQFHRYVTQYIKDKPLTPNETIEKPNKEISKQSIQPSGFKQFIPGPKDPDPKELW